MVSITQQFVTLVSNDRRKIPKLNKWNEFCVNITTRTRTRTRTTRTTTTTTTNNNKIKILKEKHF
jgi:hypothetical protein